MLASNLVGCSREYVQSKQLLLSNTHFTEIITFVIDAEHTDYHICCMLQVKHLYCCIFQPHPSDAMESTTLCIRFVDNITFASGWVLERNYEILYDIHIRNEIHVSLIQFHMFQGKSLPLFPCLRPGIRLLPFWQRRPCPIILHEKKFF